MYWNYPIDEHELASLLPGPYRRFARPVKQALCMFLDGLPEKRQRQILARQADLGPLATLAERLGQLAHDCPVLHKLGQLLARDARLAPELRDQLRPLEALPPAVPLPAIERDLRKALGSLERRRITLGQRALAEASVAVVMPFIDNSGPSPRHGVFKLLKPGIEERLEQELQVLSKVGAHLDECCHQLRIPRLDYELTFSQAREKLSGEIRLDQEQRRLAGARKCYADEPSVLIPALFEHCTLRVTSMERVFGARIFDAPSHSAVSKRDIATRLVHAVVSHSILSAEDEALFHADPHAGNLMLARDGRLALLDWSLAGTLRAHVRAAIMQLLFSALTFDREKIREIVYGLDTAGRVDAAVLERIIAFKLRGLGRGCLPGLTWLVGLFDDAVREAGLRLSPELVLFRKSLHSLDGVVSELATGDVRVDDVLIVDFLRQFIAEWPQRFFQSLNSRNLRTRISNADLAKLMLSLPIVFTRWLIESLNDLFIAKQPICLKFGTPAAADVP